MGFLDSLAGVMQSLAVDKITSGSLTVLLLQSAIPSRCAGRGARASRATRSGWRLTSHRGRSPHMHSHAPATPPLPLPRARSMLITKVFLKTSYRGSQYVGAVVVIAGLAAALGPSLANGAGGQAASDTALWSSVLILSTVPMCLSSVYKEKALGDTGEQGRGSGDTAHTHVLRRGQRARVLARGWLQYARLSRSPRHPFTSCSPARRATAEIDAIYLNFWVAVWQFVLGFPLLVPMAPASNLAITDIGEQRRRVGASLV
jgi:hypothetical protein